MKLNRMSPRLRRVVRNAVLDAQENVEFGMLAEFVQLELATAKRVIGIDKDVVFTTNWNFFKYRFPKTSIHPNKHFGGIVQGMDFIYLNPEMRTMKQFKATIWHELFHLKFPKKTEAQIKMLTKKYVK